MKFRCCCSCRGFSVKPETNLALVLCLVFYLYICLGGALFLLLEGQHDTMDFHQKLDNRTVILVRMTRMFAFDCVYQICFGKLLRLS